MDISTHERRARRGPISDRRAESSVPYDGPERRGSPRIERGSLSDGGFGSPPFSLLSRDGWLQALAGLFVVAFCVSTLVVHRHNGYNTFWDGFAYNAAFALPILPMLLCARRSVAHRRAWNFMAMGVALNITATLVYTYHDQNLTPIPKPAISDVAYLLSYACFIIGVALLTQSRMGKVHASVRLDGVIAGLAIASVVGMLWFEPVLRVSGHPLQVVVGMAYPVADLVLLVLLVAGLAPNRYRPNWPTGLLMAGALCFVVGDVVYLNQQAANTYVGATMLDWTWPFGVWLMGLAASTRDRRGSGANRLSSPLPLTVSLVPVIAGLLSIAVIAFSLHRHESPIISLLALAALILVIARMWMTLDEERHLVTSSKIDARTDALTGLPNRRYVLEELESLLEGAGQCATGVILIDLDGFKEVNDALGHLAGDQLLCIVGQRFNNRAAHQGTLARLGGDEFAFVTRPATEESMIEVAQGLLATLANPCVLEGISVRVGASMGIAVARGDNANATELLRGADVAMYESKRSHSGYCVYETKNDPNSREHLSLLGDLRVAIDSRSLTLHYQPTLDMRTGLVRGVEALARWQHPVLGMLYPDTFIPMAERAGLMPQFTRAVLDEALAEADRLDRAGHHLQMSVNISRFDLVDEDLPCFIEELLARYHFSPERLTLEITESTLGSDPDRAAQCVLNLRAKGVRISIDDFGVGYSSMSQLLDLAIDELKIDKSFIIGLSSDTRATAIVRSAVELGRALGLSLVAEGIETAAALQSIQGIGADIGQGYFIARPLASALLDEFLAAPIDAQLVLDEDDLVMIN